MRMCSSVEDGVAAPRAGRRLAVARGFTLIELMVTAAILAVLAGITLTAMETLRPKADTATYAAEVTAALTNAKFRATSENEYVYFVWVPAGVDTASNPFAGFVVCASGRADYVPATSSFDSTDPCGTCPDGSACAQLVEKQALPTSTEGTAGTDFQNLNALSTPFRLAINLGSEVDADGCSFCDPGETGWIRFLPRGEVRIQGTPEPRAAALVFKANYVQEDTREVRAVVVTAPYGLVRSFADG